jgi:ubiquinone/menaquinone biosynthesis C-methylase UbiE
MNTLQQAFNHLSGGRVLDVGTGNGNFARVLIENLKDYAEIVGIDTNERAINAARANFTEPNVRFVTMDAEHLDFPDASFDTVCLAYSLHHLANVPQVLSEMRRVLKPAGNFIIAEMYRDQQTDAQLTHVYLHHWWAEIDTALGVTHNETYTRQQIAAIAASLGLQHLTLHDYAELERDPKDAATLEALDKRIEQTLVRAQTVPNASGLQQRGAELRERIHAIGFHSATILIAVGTK